MAESSDEVTEESFPLDKILTTSAREYLNHRSGAFDLEMKGVYCDEEDLEAFAALVPEGTEVVGDYHIQIFGAGPPQGDFKYRQSGIALVSKSYLEEKRRRGEDGGEAY
jgi:hypothetical protein|tara:strand:- start:9042 stop:9368 length:327 start_codon:yes stop_codon:yes gene_type:complete